MTPLQSEKEERITYSRQPLLWLASAFASGIAVATLTEIDLVIAGAMTAASAIGAYALKERAGISYLLLSAFLFLGSFCFQFEIASTPEHRIKRIYDEARIASGTPVEIEGTLAGRPEPAHDGVIIRLLSDKLTYSGGEVLATGTVRLFLPLSESEQFVDLHAL